MRARAAMALGAAALAMHCAHGAPPSAPVPSSTVALSVVDAGADRAGVPDAGALPKLETEPEAAITEDCTRKAFLRTALGDDAQPSSVEWIRCKKRDRLLLTAPDGAHTTLFSNDGEEDVVELDYVRALALAAPGAPPSRQIAYSVHSFGTGNIHDWRIVDRKGGALREWKVGDYYARWAPLLQPGEDVRKQLEYGVAFEAGRVLVAGLVYRAGDANCCPSGGAIHAELVPADGFLRVVNVWRSAP